MEPTIAINPDIANITLGEREKLGVQEGLFIVLKTILRTER